jgi:hypothetical protein
MISQLRNAGVNQQATILPTFTGLNSAGFFFAMSAMSTYMARTFP